MQTWTALNPEGFCSSFQSYWQEKHCTGHAWAICVHPQPCSPAWVPGHRDVPAEICLWSACLRCKATEHHYVFVVFLSLVRWFIAPVICCPCFYALFITSSLVELILSFCGVGLFFTYPLAWAILRISYERHGRSQWDSYVAAFAECGLVQCLRQGLDGAGPQVAQMAKDVANCC